jgi:hypothetical protein
MMAHVFLEVPVSNRKEKFIEEHYFEMIFFLSLACNGRWECPDGSDEARCYKGD